MKNNLLSLSTFSSVFSYSKTYKHLFRDPALSVEKRIENLLALLTVGEIIGMMNNFKAVLKRY